MTFKDDLYIGKEVEKKVLGLINQKYPLAFMINGKFSPYDIFIPEVSQSVEVKSDKKSQHTGNLVVEVSMYGKPSGLMATLADFWVIFTGIEYIWIRPESLKDMIVLFGLPLKTFVCNGDTEPKKAYLPKVEIVKKYAEKVVKLKKE